MLGCQRIVVVRWTGQLPLGLLYAISNLLHISEFGVPVSRNHCVSSLSATRITMHSVVKLPTCLCSDIQKLECTQPQKSRQSRADGMYISLIRINAGCLKVMEHFPLHFQPPPYKWIWSTCFSWFIEGYIKNQFTNPTVYITCSLVPGNGTWWNALRNTRKYQGVVVQLMVLTGVPIAWEWLPIPGVK